MRESTSSFDLIVNSAESSTYELILSLSLSLSLSLTHTHTRFWDKAQPQRDKVQNTQGPRSPNQTNTSTKP
ncbi:hypothetical protein RHGRI_015941 [Rhododendron griersonianum]|uniref:Uncharacterized protein n=1 Tax=Rhododendron griersonianum TaxID=479676 RepID=A0AAV6JT58_9ERIC|nr:hypothetical protein RHGRI_015941 [Rhododendron griersonianum]